MTATETQDQPTSDVAIAAYLRVIANVVEQHGYLSFTQQFITISERIEPHEPPRTKPISRSITIEISQHVYKAYLADTK